MLIFHSLVHLKTFFVIIFNEYEILKDVIEKKINLLIDSGLTSFKTVVKIQPTHSRDG